MCFLPVGLLDGELDEEERKEREDSGLEEADEYLEHHEGDRQKVWREKDGDRDNYLAGEDVAEKTERERDDAHHLADELYESDRRAYRIRKGVHDEFATVFPKTDSHDTGHLDDEEGYNGKRERHHEIRRRRAQERVGMVFDRADARDEVDHVADEDEKEDRHEEREKFPDRKSTRL